MAKAWWFFGFMALVACANDPAPATLDSAMAADAARVDTLRRPSDAIGGPAPVPFQEPAVPPPRASFDLRLAWHNRGRVEARVALRTDGTAVYFRYASGSQAWWDGRHAWLLPVQGDTLTARQARFDLLAWHYLFCLPWKLQDPGTHWQPLPDRTIDGHPCSVGRLTFDPGTGESPDDWFVVFSDRVGGQLRAATYIVTYGEASAQQAAKTPQTIFYRNFRRIQGIPVAQRWVFTGWQTDSLNGGVPLGEARLSGIQWEAAETLFRVPAVAVKI